MELNGVGNSIRERLTLVLRQLFPERQLHLRTAGRISFIRVSRSFQIGVVVVFAALFGWGAFATVNYGIHDRVVASKDMQIANVRLAYQSLLREVATYQQRFSDVARDLEENHTLMLSLVEQNTALQKNLKHAQGKLHSNQQEQDEILARSEALKNSLHDLSNNVQNLSNRNFTLRNNLDETQVGLTMALEERNLAQRESKRMADHAAALEVRLKSLEENQDSAIQKLAEQTTNSIDGLERVIDLTGIKVATLLAADSERFRDQGGPFIPVEPDKLPAGRLKASLTNLDSQLERWESLQNLMSRLPLATPLNYFQISSRFGKRRDPMNQRWAMHYGLDFGGILKSSIYVTAPGIVTHVGWKGKYGKLVEVDHGAGLKTRYGHVHKILVKKNQEVRFRDKIALLGSTGRSTGAHLHYEVLFKGRQVDPMKFIKAGRYVFKE